MKKKPNYKLRRRMAVLILIIIALIPIIIINKTKIMNISLYINNIKYSKTIDALFESEYTNSEAEKLINSLKNKNKINKKTTHYILKFNSKGYSKNTINYVLNNLSDKDITVILSKDYNKDFEKYVKIKLFDFNKYNRYLKYQEKYKKLNLDQVVTRVELNLDKDFYENAKKEKNPDSITCLVNKYRYLSENYTPSDLVDMDDKYANNKDNQKRLRKEAYEWFKKMVDKAKEDDISFYAESAFRTYKYQQTIYNSYLNSIGKEKTESIAARPGFSEHQTGLSIDLANTWTIKEDGEEYNWIKKNGYKYGYIIRYEPSNEDITGFGAESWHIRYVGKKAATIIHKKNITLDEYVIKYEKNHK